MTTIAILGLGEAGRLYARGLGDAGADVRAHDPFHRLDDPGVHQVAGLADTLDGADVVLSLVAARSAQAAATEALPILAATAVYADLNTGSPELKRTIAAEAHARGIRMADVAVLAPVARAAHLTPLLASGDGASALRTLLEPLGVPISEIEGGPGAAARLKLLRSLFMKGLAAVTIESLDAAASDDEREWLRDQIAGELAGNGGETVDRLVDGTTRHAVRRERELRDVLAELQASGSDDDMARAAHARLRRLIDGAEAG